jgi:hypothetical protein
LDSRFLLSAFPISAFALAAFRFQLSAFQRFPDNYAARFLRSIRSVLAPKGSSSAPAIMVLGSGTAVMGWHPHRIAIGTGRLQR